jgi:endoglucanase
MKASVVRALATVGVCAAAVTSLAGAATSTQFYVPKPDKGALAQISDLLSNQDKVDAALIRAMTNKSHAVWFTGGTPAEVQRQVRETVNAAAGQHSVPVLVAYDVPFRDCGQFSAGGALNTADYLAWIEGFARGIGSSKAVVLLEPDGLGIIPYNTDINGNAEWCQPALSGTGLTPLTANQARYEQISGAVVRLERQPNVRVYLDGTHSAWLGVGDIAQRLAKAGVANAQGFFLNVSNYQFTQNGVQYGTWISDCLASGNYAGCPNQYWNGGPDGTAIASLLGAWNGVALSNYGVWSDTASDPALNTSGINARFSTLGTTHFVIDTSRNGLGPWRPTASYPDAQDWCNPPGRGLGIRPTAETGNALVDAYLWVKVPGESDGSCNRGIAGSTTDPEWGGITDPAAGAWFPQQALQLARLSSPPLQP